MQVRADFFPQNYGLSTWTKHPEVYLRWYSEIQIWGHESPRTWRNSKSCWSRTSCTRADSHCAGEWKESFALQCQIPGLAPAAGELSQSYTPHPISASCCHTISLPLPVGSPLTASHRRQKKSGIPPQTKKFGIPPQLSPLWFKQTLF